MITNTNEYAKNYKGPYKTVVVPKNCEDVGVYVNSILKDVEEHTTVSFETGRYFFKDAIELNGKKDIVIEGNNSIFVANYIPSEFAYASKDVFHIENCEEIALKNFIVESSVPINVSGTICNVGEDYFDLDVDKNIPFDGNELNIQGYTFSPFGYPTYGNAMAEPLKPTENNFESVAEEIACTFIHPNIKHEKIDDRTLRVYSDIMSAEGVVEEAEDMKKVGNRFMMRYPYYGPAAFRFRHTHNVVVEDVRVRAFGGMAFVILPRCSNFTFENVEFAAKNPNYELMSVNADAIHLSGLMGKLVIRNCTFRNLGDDALNAHTQILKIREIGNKCFKPIYDKIGGLVSPMWAQKGDILHIYDPKTLKRKYELTVKDFIDNVVYYDEDIDISETDIVFNYEYHPEILIENCSTYGLRRGFVIQGTRKATVKNCKFHNLTLAGVYISKCFQTWYEGGPAENIEICDNIFYGCDTWATQSYAAITGWIRGNYAEGTPNIHKNINIHHNIFENIPARPISLDWFDGVTIKDNVFANCSYKNEKILLGRCTNASVENNTII